MWPERPNKKSMWHETPAERGAALRDLKNVFSVLWSEAGIELAFKKENGRKIISIITLYFKKVF